MSTAVTVETQIVVDVPRPVPPSWWGKDHWSTLLYVECRCVDHKGWPNHPNMRTDFSRHPGYARAVLGMHSAEKYPTRLRHGTEGVLLTDHDDWDCVEDMEAAGLVQAVGTGSNPRWKLTELGHTVAGKLRAHKAQGQGSGTFKWSP